MKYAMRGIFAFSIVALAAIAVSCATGSAGTKAEKGPTFVDIKIWKANRVETAYPDGMLSGIITRTYDDKGNLVSEEEFSGNKTLVSRKVYTAGANGVVAIVTLDNAGTVIGKAERTMADDRILAETQTNATGEFQASERYTYDAAGQKTKWEVKTASGNQLTTEYSYDAGNLVRIVVRDAAGKTVKRFERIFDETPGVKAEEEYDGAGTLVAKTVYTYEGAYPVREDKSNAYGAPLSSISYKNDADGNPVEITYADRNGRVVERKKQAWISFTRTVKVQ